MTQFNKNAHVYIYTVILGNVWKTFLNKYVLSLLRRLLTWRYPHRPLHHGARSCRSICPTHRALSSKPAGRRCCCRSMGQTDGRTDRCIDPGAHTMRAASIMWTAAWFLGSSWASCVVGQILHHGSAVACSPIYSRLDHGRIVWKTETDRADYSQWSIPVSARFYPPFLVNWDYTWP